jgi:peptidoglycan LD-endopeptidase LytH
MSKRLLVSMVLVAAVAGGYYLYRLYRPSGERMILLHGWMNNPSAHPEWKLAAASRCGDAPFIFPTAGMIGFLWDDSFQPGHRHQGIDIFGGSDVGVTPVIAAYPGYLTRLPDWKSTVIVRIPSDPLHPGRQIWTYYTHMATKDGVAFISEDFPPGTYEKFVEAGTLLGYQGNYSGDPNNPVGVHLHFSIVKDDGQGSFRNELLINNTYDPSPYLGLRLNANENPDTVPVCESDS